MQKTERPDEKGTEAIRWRLEYFSPLLIVAFNVSSYWNGSAADSVSVPF